MTILNFLRWHLTNLPLTMHMMRWSWRLTLSPSKVLSQLVRNQKIYNQQCTDPAKIAQEFNDLFDSFFTHNDHTVEITSPELEVQNICIMSFSSDMVLDRIKKN